MKTNRYGQFCSETEPDMVFLYPSADIILDFEFKTSKKMLSICELKRELKLRRETTYAATFRTEWTDAKTDILNRHNNQKTNIATASCNILELQQLVTLKIFHTNVVNDHSKLHKHELLLLLSIPI